MIEQETDLPITEEVAQPADAGQILAAIIAITRRDWLLQRHASVSPYKIVVNRAPPPARWLKILLAQEPRNRGNEG